MHATFRQFILQYSRSTQTMHNASSKNLYIPGEQLPISLIRQEGPTTPQHPDPLPTHSDPQRLAAPLAQAPNLGAANAFSGPLLPDLPAPQTRPEPCLNCLPQLGSARKRATPDSGFDAPPAGDAKYPRTEREEAQAQPPGQMPVAWPVPGTGPLHPGSGIVPAPGEYAMSDLSSAESCWSTGAGSLHGSFFTPLHANGMVTFHPALSNSSGNDALPGQEPQNDFRNSSALAAGRDADSHPMLGHEQTAYQPAEASKRERVLRRALTVPDSAINVKDKDQNTLLMQAVGWNFADIVAMLLARPGIDVNVKCEGGYTALIEAAHHGFDTIVRMLLAIPKINVNAKDDYGRTALMHVAQCDHGATVRALLDIPGIDVNAEDNEGNNAAMLAAEKYCDDIAWLLIASMANDIGDNDSFTERAFYAALARGNIAPVRTWLAQPGIDINARYCRYTALTIAAGRGDAAMVRLLLDTPGIDVNVTDAKERTPLFIAATCGHLAVVRALLAVPGIDINCRGRWENTALNQAASYGHKAIVLELLARPEVDIDAPDVDDRSVLEMATEADADIVEVLLAVPNIRLYREEYISESALHLSIHDGNERMTRLLLAMPGIYVGELSEEAMAFVWRATENERWNAKKLIELGKDPRAAKVLTEDYLPSATEAADVRQLLERIFATRSSRPTQGASSSSSRAPDAGASSEDGSQLGKAFENLQFGKYAAADVPALFHAIDPLGTAEKSALAMSLAFAVCTGHYRNADGTLSHVIASCLDRAGLRPIYADTLAKLRFAAQDINLYRSDAMNLLAHAASTGNERMIRGLVRLGAHVNLPSPNGKTALAIAIEGRQWGACAELISHGAEPLLPLHGGYPALYHIVMNFCSDEHACESLALLIRYLRIKGVPFDIPVKNPVESMRESVPTVMLNDLLVSNAQSWCIYGHIVYGLKDEAPATTGAVLTAQPNPTPGALPATPVPTPSLAPAQVMLAADEPLDDFTAWLAHDPHHPH